MPNKKPISQYLGNGRGAFRKAFISVLLDSYSEDDAFEVAKNELGAYCIYCGQDDTDNQLQPDFLWIQSEGGLLKKGNVVPACPHCNSKRGAESWETFIIKSTIEESQKAVKIKEIQTYMKRYGMETKPDINDYIDTEQVKILKELNILLDALTQGLRAKIDNPQIKDIKFKEPERMFDDLVNIAEKYLL